LSASIFQFGCGNMGGAMLAGWLAAGFDPAAFTVVDPMLAEAPTGVRLLAAAPDREVPADVVLLGFKPQQLASAPAIRPACWAKRAGAVDPGGHRTRGLARAFSRGGRDRARDAQFGRRAW